MPAQEETGWTQVGRRKGRLRHVAARAVETKESVEVAPNPHPTLTCADIRKDHEAFKAEWQASDCRRALQALLIARAGELPVISKAVCLGAGSFDPSTGSWAAKRTAHVQVEAFLSMVDSLTPRTADRPACIVQEPALTTADAQFCDSLGLCVVPGSSAFDEIDEHTLVFGIHLYVRTWHAALRTLPAVIVGIDMESWREVAERDSQAEEMLGRVKEVDEGYERVWFPSMNYMFSNTCVYWRKRGEREDLVGGVGEA